MAKNFTISGQVPTTIPISQMGTAETKRNHQRPASSELNRKQPITATSNGHESERTQNDLQTKLPPPPDNVTNAREQRIGGLTKSSWKLLFIFLGLTLLWRYVILEKVSKDAQLIVLRIRYSARIFLVMQIQDKALLY